MKKILMLLMLLMTICLAVPAFAANVPADGTTWVHRGKNMYGAAFQTSLTVRHGHLIITLAKGSQLDWGVIELDENNEFVVMPELHRRPFPAIERMTFKFSPDFNTVRETDVMNYQGRCVAGDCSSNVVDVDYQRQ
jgi:hypothetical protein